MTETPARCEHLTISDAHPPIPSRIRLVGHAIGSTLARAPWLWPLLRHSTRGYFGARAAGWDERTGAGGVPHLASLAAAALHVTPPPERVLEIGCGTGEGSLFLAREFRSARIRGVDLVPEMVAAAKAKVGLDPEGRIAFKVADAAALPYPDDSFDLVAQIDVPPFFAEIARVLRPGGTVIVASSHGPSTPYYAAPARLEKGFSKRGIEPLARGPAPSGEFFVGRALD